MNVLTASEDWYPDDINSRLNFNEFAFDGTGEILCIGMTCTKNKDIINAIQPFKRKVYINLEHPCTLFGEKNEIGLSAIEQQTLFDEVYTICPYSAAWLNDLDTGTTFISMPYIHNLKYDMYGGIQKEYDVAYCGLVHSDEIAGFIETMRAHKYIFSTIAPYNPNHIVDNCATHNAIPNLEKWNLLAKSRTAIIHNKLYLNPQQVEVAKSLPQWQKNEAFSHLSESVAPQFKSRTVESAMCKSLMLVKKDPWNVIERWFEPDQDFIYFEDEKDLNEKIYEINKNWTKYEFIAQNAYAKVIEKYNTKYIFQQIQKEEEIWKS